MLDIDYYREQAENYRKLAEETADERVRRELLELAVVCEKVASRIEERLPAG